MGSGEQMRDVVVGGRFMGTGEQMRSIVVVGLLVLVKKC